MAIGERIHFFRNLRGMTQKFLGMAVGFPEKSADVRLAQYETGTRTPKADLTAALAKELDVSPRALNVPDIDSDVGIMHTLFTLEDTSGLVPIVEEGSYRLIVRPNGEHGSFVCRAVQAWATEREKLRAGEITREEYDRWRYNYPSFDTSGQWHKVPPQELMDYLLDVPEPTKVKKKRDKKIRYKE